MKKLIVSIFFVLFPVLLYAADDSGASLSLRPPTTDVSVIFLSNIFGIVDGVLHGTGSQIMGAMFAVFNSAVLALGGIIIMYTLMVSTINTAHEGQMLGQKWSSIWVPVRSTLGLTLLIPKASGYCIMQIMFMWIVVQGVGAADKVWEAALNYLNRGGVIVQQQINPTQMVLGTGSAVLKGAANILYGQVCMLGIETALKNKKKQFLDSDKTLGTCKNPAYAEFCKQPVPNFLDTVKPLDYEDRIMNGEKDENGKITKPADSNAGKDGFAFAEPMPDFSSSKYEASPFKELNGICGTIVWNQLRVAYDLKGTLGTDGVDTFVKARATGLQQMYVDLSGVAERIVENNPLLKYTSPSENNKSPEEQSKENKSKIENKATAWALDQFGIPSNTGGTLCNAGKLNDTPGCVNWERDPAMKAKGPLLDGTELRGALADYNAIMLPTLTLAQQSGAQAANPRQFLDTAKTTGWMLAGSYYFKLASLSAANTVSYGGSSGAGGTVPNDSNSGLAAWGTGDAAANPPFDLTRISKPFQSTCNAPYKMLCDLLTQGGVYEKTSDVMIPITLMFKGDGSSLEFKIPDGSGPADNNNPEIKAVSGTNSSTVYGFVTNSLMMQLPGQAGNQAPKFVLDLSPNFTVKGFELPEASIPCDGFMCIPTKVAEVIYNYVLRYMFQTLINAVMTVINTVLMLFLTLPLLGMGEIFKACVDILRNPDANPIVALATMGINYINFASDMWMLLLVLAVTQMLIPIVGPFILALLGMAMPLVMAWLGVMMAIGFLTAYYIPFLPYMIFTFASIAWLMAVIEAMVAAPIVALSITHPEGEGPFGGKAEQALMILMNVFLRPALMIIGYISGIILSYVCIWVINSGFSNVLPFMQGPSSWSAPNVGTQEEALTGLGQAAALAVAGPVGAAAVGVGASEGGGVGKQLKGSGSECSGGFLDMSCKQRESLKPAPPPSDTVKANYTGWAGIYGFFFAIIIYTSMYLTVVQKAFSLIGILPDKVLRWVGAQPESIGQEAAQWTEEAKKQVQDTGKATEKAAQLIGKEAGAKAVGAAKGAKDKMSGGKAGLEGS